MDKTGRELVKTHGMRCAICGATGTCHGHEVWDYREKEKVGTAVLLRIEMICIDCHDVHHWGHTVVLFAQSAITAERYNHLKKHFRRVNGFRQEVFANHRQEALQLWEQRSKKRWKIDWGDCDRRGRSEGCARRLAGQSFHPLRVGEAVANCPGPRRVPMLETFRGLDLPAQSRAT